MKLVMYVEFDCIDYLNKILKESNIIDGENTIQVRCNTTRFPGSVKVIFTPDEYTYLIDNDVIEFSPNAML